MTESDWLTSTDPQAMLAFLRDRGPVSDRKLRLFAVACCRRLYPLLRDPVVAESLDTAERMLGCAAPDDLLATRRRLVEAANEAFGERYGAEAAANFCAHPAYTMAWATEQAVNAVARLFEDVAVPFGLPPVLDPQRPIEGEAYLLAVGAVASTAEATAEMVLLPRRTLDEKRVLRELNESYVNKARWSELAVQADFLRDIFGNPFSPVSFRPEWRTEAVVSLARGVYEERAWDRMPVLADSLEDAGCADPELLGHCRASTTHVRGCWAVDSVLGKP